MGEWYYEVKHGPDDQDDYSWVYASGVMVCACKTKDAIEIVKACNRRDDALVREAIETLRGWYDRGDCGCDTSACRGTCMPAKTADILRRIDGEI